MSDPEISELGKVKIRVGILKGMRSGTVITADALQQTIHSKHRDPFFTEMINDLDKEIEVGSALIKRMETIGR